jgi:hypothetical protein
MLPARQGLLRVDAGPSHYLKKLRKQADVRSADDSIAGAGKAERALEAGLENIEQNFRDPCFPSNRRKRIGPSALFKRKAPRPSFSGLLRRRRCSSSAPPLDETLGYDSGAATMFGYCLTELGPLTALALPQFGSGAPVCKPPRGIGFEDDLVGSNPCLFGRASAVAT